MCIETELLRYSFLTFHLSSNGIQQEKHFLILHPIRASQIDPEANHDSCKKNENLFPNVTCCGPMSDGTDQIGGQTHGKTTQEDS
jgi:hypothetical protein